MAVRTITTILKLDKEEEYQNKIKSVNLNLKTLRSEMAEVTSRFQNNANSLEALKAKSEIYNAQLKQQVEKLNAAKAAHSDSIKAQKEYSDEVEKLKKALEALNTTTEKNAVEEKKLKDELKNAQTGYYEATNAVHKWNTQINYAQADINKLNNVIDKNNDYIK